MEQTSDLLNTGSHMETGTTVDQEYMWSVYNYIRRDGRKIGRKWRSKGRCDCKASEKTLIFFKKAKEISGYKLHSPWLVRHPIIVIFFLTFKFEENKIILDIVWHFWQLLWMWWIFILRFSQLPCEPSYHHTEILLSAIKIGLVVEMLTCKGTSFNWRKVVLLLINRDQLLSIIGDYTVCCVSQKTKTW